MFVVDHTNGVMIIMTDTDVMAVHQKVAAMKEVIAGELNALCLEEPILCCSIINTFW